MAVEQENRRSFGTLRGPYALVVYLLGMVGVYVGERLIGGEGVARWMVSGAGALLVLASCLAWLLAWLRSKAEARWVERLAFLLSVGGLLALMLYLIGSDLVLGPGPVTRSGQADISVRQVLAVAWPIVWTCTLLPLVFVQWSAISMAGGKGVEITRVRGSALAGATTAMLLCTLFLINAIANRKDISRDLSYFKTASPSDSTREMVQGMDTDTQALMFFPAYNEVLEEVRPYFEELDGLSARFQVSVVDRALEPELAKKHRVSNDGAVVLARGEERQKIDLGLKLDRAKRKLRKLDAEFQKAILKMTHERKTVYLITGHGERGARKAEGDPRQPYSRVKGFLTSKNLTVKNLGAVEGLASEVPDDAAVVMWIDPTSPPYPGEVDSLKAYLQRGGRLLLSLDPENRPGLDPFLEFLGLKYSQDKVAHSRAIVPLSRTPADRYNIVTISYSSHASVSTISKHKEALPAIFPSTGSLEKVAGTKQRVTFIVRTPPNSWADVDGNMVRGKEEKARTLQLAAVVSAKVKGREKKETESKESHKAGEDQAKKKPGEKKDAEDEMRVAVFADSDIFSDRFFESRLVAGGFMSGPGNKQLFADVLAWLVGEGQVGGVAKSEEDIQIAHTRAEDVIWFYLTVFAVPLLILGVGAATRWGRGWKKRRAA